MIYSFIPLEYLRCVGHALDVMTAQYQARVMSVHGRELLRTVLLGANRTFTRLHMKPCT
jgi:hypothetical protein